jgi:hypothetical protein
MTKLTWNDVFDAGKVLWLRGENHAFETARVAGYKFICWHDKVYYSDGIKFELGLTRNDLNKVRYTREEVLSYKKEAYNTGLHDAAVLMDSYGDQCAGGDGQAIVPSGPSKGQKYGAAWYNAANGIRKLIVE